VCYLLLLELFDFKVALRDGVETAGCDAIGVSDDSATTLGFSCARTCDANLNRGLGFVHTSGAF
jgi:hypothetical protein